MERGERREERGEEGREEGREEGGERREEKRERREERGEEREEKRGERERRKERGGERGERDDPGPTSPKWFRPWGVIIIACTCHVSAFGFVAPIWLGFWVSEYKYRAQRRLPLL